MLKPPVEVLYKEELAALKKYDDGIKPESWLLSPKAVRTFILGSNKPLVYRNKEVKITKKSKIYHICSQIQTNACH